MGSGRGGSAGAAGLAQDVEEAYLENPYHNSTHAADVTQGLCAMLACNGFAAALTDLEMLSMVLSCAIHDVGHPGDAPWVIHILYTRVNW